MDKLKQMLLSSKIWTGIVAALVILGIVPEGKEEATVAAITVLASVFMFTKAKEDVGRAQADADAQASDNSLRIATEERETAALLKDVVDQVEALKGKTQ